MIKLIHCKNLCKYSSVTLLTSTTITIIKKEWLSFYHFIYVCILMYFNDGPRAQMLWVQFLLSMSQSKSILQSTSLVVHINSHSFLVWQQKLIMSLFIGLAMWCPRLENRQMPPGEETSAWFKVSWNKTQMPGSSHTVITYSNPVPCNVLVPHGQMIHATGTWAI
jgi:hypothetical protein